MFAIVSLQGFQYRVAAGETLRVPALDRAQGDKLDIADVHLISGGGKVWVGRPTVPEAKVTAEVVGHGRGPKTLAGKYKRRKDYRRRWGFRTHFTELRIEDIVEPRG
ncbi:MAG: 50S ribosomal protein L21 [Candidatus Eisenbacteria bacterium]|uniref:Large ribosomal subunit protein bL21 n=1 Tax=Eiseniibacteriota bacterium TaxID=2212470 RepID=A0A937XBW1_UNCEI|nr:50S ribosomal protein L21 [Candidatus Eisenbacteria bacterium]